MTSRTDQATTSTPSWTEQEREAEAVWRRLDAMPGFTEELRQAEADILAGLGTPFHPRVAEAERSVRPWEHPYETESGNFSCVNCGLVGSYIHTDPESR